MEEKYLVFYVFLWIVDSILVYRLYSFALKLGTSFLFRGHRCISTILSPVYTYTIWLWKPRANWKDYGEEEGRERKGGMRHSLKGLYDDLARTFRRTCGEIWMSVLRGIVLTRRYNVVGDDRIFFMNILKLFLDGEKI